MKQKEIIYLCKTHGLTVHAIDNQIGWKRCRKCSYEYLRTRQKKVKKLLVEEHGGKCVICGYNKCIQALEFHHVDPSTKSFSISANSKAASIKKLTEEAKKCILVCANCHVEIERGLVDCPSLYKV